MITPIVITSKKANNHLDMIRSHHDDLVSGMQMQKVRVDAYNQQKEVERQAKIVQDQQFQKDQLEADRKMKEIQIKQQALSM